MRWLLVASLLAAPPAGAATRALLIGLTAYDPLANPARSFSALKGPANDVALMRQLLVGRLGLAPEAIRVLPNAKERGTREELLANLRWLAAASKPGDLALLFYAGHGSQQVNSLSAERDLRDETLVPIDLLDLRDKELAVELNRILDAGAQLTAIFDSCHSGSNTRGVTVERAGPLEAKDARDPTRVVNGMAECEVGRPCVVAPEARGAIIISAAQAGQAAVEAEDETGLVRGVFTSAFASALRQNPNASVEQLFRQARARLKDRRGAQEPELRGPAARLTRSLLGAAAAQSGRVTAYVKRSKGDQVELEGGAALGLARGCRLASTKGPRTELELIAEPTLTTSVARLVAGELPRAGAEFSVTRWTRGASTPLAIYVPPSVPLERWQALREAALTIKTVAEPTEGKLDGLITWDGAQWVLITRQGTRQLGPTLEAAPRASLAILLPPVEGLELKGLDVPEGALRRAASIDSADYVLAGAPRGGWALLQPAALFTEAPLPMPRRTDWVTLQGAALEETLGAHARSLARMKGWLTLEPPEPFPFEVRLEAGGAPAGLLAVGQQAEVVLEQRPSAEARAWYVYLLALDTNGRALVPLRESNAFITNQPRAVLATLDVSQPTGLDHLVVLASATPLPTTRVLEFDPVRTRASELGGLAALLADLGLRSEPTSPGAWTSTRLTARSVVPWALGAIAEPTPTTPPAAPSGDGPLIELVPPARGAGAAVLEWRFTPRKAAVDASSLVVELITDAKTRDVTRALLDAGSLSQAGLEVLAERGRDVRLRLSLADEDGRRSSVEHQLPLGRE